MPADQALVAPFDTAEEAENHRRTAALDQLAVQRAKLDAEYAALRRKYADAMAAEQAPPPAGPSESLAALYARREDIKRRLGDLVQERSRLALAGAEGDRKAAGALSKAVADYAAGEIELENLDLAIKQAEARDAEDRREFEERTADTVFAAGQAAVGPMTEWAEEADRLFDAIAAHYAKLPPMRTALMKSGADIDGDMLGRLFIKATNDRAAKAAGLHQIINMDSTVTATRLGDAFKSLLRAAVRRPDIGRKIAS